MRNKLIAALLIVSVIFSAGAPAFAADTVIATPTSSDVLVDRRSVMLDAYNIGGSNYFKLRDLAYVFSNTEKRFNVGWDGASNTISLTSGEEYTVVGGEMKSKGTGNKTAVPTSSKLIFDGDEVTATAFYIEGNNYFKLRDIAEMLNFKVDWDGASDTISIETVSGYIDVFLEWQEITDERLAEMVASGEIPADVTRLILSSDLISDISPLGSLAKLKELFLDSNNIRDITALGSLTKLTKLNLHNGNISDVSPLGNLTSLKELNLSGKEDLSDITALSSLTKLTKLELFGTNISDVSPLGKLTKLTTLSIGGYNSNISDITALSNLTELTQLRLDGTRVSDLSALSKLTNLTFLSLRDLIIGDFSPLYKLPKLTSLYLSLSNINDDLSVLKQFPHLTELYLFGCNISDVTALGSLTNLKVLNLSNNNITDVSPLFSLTNLVNLSLNHNQINDILPLYNLTNLTYLFLQENPIAQQDIDKLAAALPDTYIGSVE